MKASPEKKTSFILYADWYATICLLTEREKANFVDAIFQHNAGKTDLVIEERLKPFLDMVFEVMDENKAKYKQRCIANAEHANEPPKNPQKRRGRPPKPKPNG